MTPPRISEPGSLKPRAIAVLCCLRGEPRSDASIRAAIGDGALSATRELLTAMTVEGLISQLSGSRYLNDAGVAWLETHGLHAEQGARISVVCARLQVKP